MKITCFKNNLKKILKINPVYGYIAIGAFFVTLFWFYQGLIYRGLDGSFYSFLNNQSKNNEGSILGLSLDHYQGCSSLQFPVNFKLSLTFVLAKIFPFTQKANFFISSLLIICVCTKIISTIAELSQIESFFLFLLNCMALLPIPLGFYGLAGCAPMYPEVAVLQSIAVLLLLKKETSYNALYILSAYFINLYLLLCYPTLIVVLLPLSAIMFYNFIVQICTFRNKHKGLLKANIINNILIHLCGISVAGIIGLWVLGHIFHSSFFIFKNELNEKISFADISLVFWAAKSNSAVALLAFSLIGCTLNMFPNKRQIKENKKLSFLLFGFFCFQLLAFFVMLLGFNIKRGFPLIYIEYMFYPLFFIILVSQIKNELSMGQKENAIKIRLKNNIKVLFSVTAFLLLLGFFKQIKSLNKNLEADYFCFPESNEIINKIKKLKGTVAQNEKFFGRTEAFLGIGNPRRESYDWLDFHAFQGLCTKVWKNDFRTTGLWVFEIPTLFQYTPLRNPFIHYLGKNLLAGPADSTWKNVPVYSIPFSPVLGLLGVRFIISDNLLDDKNLKILCTIRYPDSSKKEKDIWWTKQNEKNPWQSINGIRLYEVLNVNIGDKSPILIKIKSNKATNVLSEMKAGKLFFNERPLAVVSEANIGEMTETKDADVYYTKSGMHVQAKAAGLSCLLLPITFSHCLRIKYNIQQKTNSVRLIRANLAQTLLIFEKNIDAELQYVSSPFINPWSIWLDYLDAKRILIN